LEDEEKRSLQCEKDSVEFVPENVDDLKVFGDDDITIGDCANMERD